jgi:hypothetical protein
LSSYFKINTKNGSNSYYKRKIRDWKESHLERKKEVAYKKEVEEI